MGSTSQPTGPKPVRGKIPTPNAALWQVSAPRATPDLDGLVHGLDGCSWDSQPASSDHPEELTQLTLCRRNAEFAEAQRTAERKNKLHES